jgi:putative phosphoesterase
MSHRLRPAVPPSARVRAAPPRSAGGTRAVVGLVSDTHGRVRPQLATVFAGVDLIVHAGDVGGRAVLEALAAMAPVEAVSGNVDDRHDPSLPRTRTLPVGGRTLHVSHGDELGSPTPEALLARYSAGILVYGHTHRPLLVRAPDGRIVVNPGAAGPQRFHLKPSVAILTVTGHDVDVRFIELP